MKYGENIDPIGACIGPRGARVQAIINELNGEKIDIFEWSDNIATLISNALSPSEGVAVIPNDNVKDGLIVVVPDNQLSLAIGKGGKNARLAVKLSGHKIDIKSQSEMDALGIDYMGIAAKMQEEYEAKKAKERAYKQQEKIKALKESNDEIENVDVAEFDYDEEEEENAPVESLFETEKNRELSEMEEAARLAKEKRKSGHEVKEYTSKFEEFAGTGKPEPKAFVTEVKKEEPKVESPKEEVKKAIVEGIKPIYSDEELAEIEESEYDDDVWDDDIDYEEYDSYYDD